jgi:sulfur carrier protein
MTIVINGERRDVPENLTVTTMLQHLGLAEGRVAIERNLEILPRGQWNTTVVQVNDSFEIVHFVGGG